jgi:hypothetical protein
MQGSKVSALDLVLNHYATQAILNVTQYRKASVAQMFLARRAARCIAPSILLSTSYLPCRLLHRTFLSLVDVLPAALLTAWLVSFSCRRLARHAVHSQARSLCCGHLSRHAARCIARIFLLPTSFPLCRSLDRSFLSLADGFPAAPLAALRVSVTR